MNKRRERLDNYDRYISNRCKKCKGKLYIKIYRNNIGNRQMGLYCSMCNKYVRFINDNDVFYYVGIGCNIKNEYGPLNNTKLFKLKNITNITYQKNH